MDATTEGRVPILEEHGSLLWARFFPDVPQHNDHKSTRSLNICSSERYFSLPKLNACSDLETSSYASYIYLFNQELPEYPKSGFHN
jgi:hypothetical protein